MGVRSEGGMHAHAHDTMACMARRWILTVEGSARGMEGWGDGGR